MSLRGQLARSARGAEQPWLAVLASLFGLLASELPTAPVLAYTARGWHEHELWRLWTAHFVHYGSAHLWGDLLAFLVWAALVERESRRALLLTLTVGAPLLMAALALTCPGLGQYRGLSGLDTALVIELIFLRGFASPPRAEERGLGPWLSRSMGSRALRSLAVFCLLLSAVKIVYEFYAGHALLARDLGNSASLLPAAHAFGALVGLGVCICSPRAGLTQSLTPQY